MSSGSWRSVPICGDRWRAACRRGGFDIGFETLELVAGTGGRRSQQGVTDARTEGGRVTTGASGEPDRSGPNDSRGACRRTIHEPVGTRNILVNRTKHFHHLGDNHTHARRPAKRGRTGDRCWSTITWGGYPPGVSGTRSRFRGAGSPPSTISLLYAHREVGVVDDRPRVEDRRLGVRRSGTRGDGRPAGRGVHFVTPRPRPETGRRRGDQRRRGAGDDSTGGERDPGTRGARRDGGEHRFGLGRPRP